ncbi:MAG: GNAT family N-acetyltransferase [Magnetococcus sp. DMHC-8]
MAGLEALIAPSPWTAGMFDEEIVLGSHCRVLTDTSDGLLGYSVARLLVDEWHLLTLGTAPAVRRCGGARRLLQDLVRHATAHGGHSLLLEVRASNLPARTLYQDMGFHFLYARKGYYRLGAGTEDALFLCLPLVGPSVPSLQQAKLVCPAQEGNGPESGVVSQFSHKE